MVAKADRQMKNTKTFAAGRMFFFHGFEWFLDFS